MTVRLGSGRRSVYGGSSPFGALVGILAVAIVTAAVFVLDVPSRIAELGSGNLERLVAPTTTVAFGESVELAGRAERPPLVLQAASPVRVEATTRGVRVPKGMKFVGLPLTVRNVGATVFVAAMGADVTAADEQGTAYRPVSGLVKLRGRHVLKVARVPPGAVRRGVVVFQVPRGSSISSMRFTVGSGLTRTAEWSLDTQER